jgi:hypothetical protein
VADPVETLLNDSTEDFAKRTWDFWRADDSPVSTLEELSRILAISDTDAAALVMTYPFPDAVPLELMREAADVLGQ